MILKNYQKQKQGKQEKSESNLLFNRLCKNLWMIFANVIYGPILSFVPRLNYISISQINVEVRSKYVFSFSEKTTPKRISKVNWKNYKIAGETFKSFKMKKKEYDNKYNTDVNDIYILNIIRICIHIVEYVKCG